MQWWRSRCRGGASAGQRLQLLRVRYAGAACVLRWVRMRVMRWVWVLGCGRGSDDAASRCRVEVDVVTEA